MAENAPAARGPVTVDVADAQARQMIVGMAVAGAFGVVAVAAAITGDVVGGTGVRVAAFLIGLVFTLIGVLPLLMWRVAFRRRRLVLDAGGIRWDDPDGSPWSVRWPELSRVELAAREPDTGGPRMSAAVHLLLYPAGPEFRDAHPEMRHLAVARAGAPDGAYLLPFGHAHRVVGPIDDGLTAFAPGLYRTPGTWVPVPGRPRAVVASVALLGACWLAAVVPAVLNAGASGKTVATVAFWTAAVALWLARIWLGGPLATGQMARFAPTLGAVLFLGILLIAAAGYSGGHPPDPSEDWVLLLLLLPGAAVFTAGRLLARDDVRAWSRARGQGR
ncbi:hypothetical protein [Actinomadura sp. WMMB 499]|uniref:hypothetical protein n=1 Tax=Actinomadura sp. WMMB 499 TaxID=1219491 RepID=UPI0012488B88|nr:hypothetical protein [Actinomadura sp. WMMB 499]QFG21165.1 hypothetical protein F7P10_08440 [Actinomadura sp. WMMB 499]